MSGILAYRGVDLLADLWGGFGKLALEAVDVRLQDRPRLLTHTDAFDAHDRWLTPQSTPMVNPQHGQPTTWSTHLHRSQRVQRLFKQRQRDGLVEADLCAGPGIRGEEPVLVGDAGVVLADGFLHLAVFCLHVTQPQMDVCIGVMVMPSCHACRQRLVHADNDWRISQHRPTCQLRGVLLCSALVEHFGSLQSLPRNLQVILFGIGIVLLFPALLL